MEGGSGETFDVDIDVATAVGLVVLDEVDLHEAADIVGTTRWELEEAIESAGLAEFLGIDPDADVAEEIDTLLDEYS